MVFLSCAAIEIHSSHDEYLMSAKSSSIDVKSESGLLSGTFITVYGGRYTDRHLGEKVLMLKKIYYEDSWLQTIAVGKILFDNNPHFRIELEAQFANHIGEQKHYEFNFLAAFRLQYTPFSFLSPFTFAFGNGVSYATEVPVIEDRSRTNVNASQFLNYLLLEVAASHPKVSNWEMVGRIHHRSGVFGLYNGVRGGSNVMAIGLRHYF